MTLYSYLGLESNGSAERAKNRDHWFDNVLKVDGRAALTLEKRHPERFDNITTTGQLPKTVSSQGASASATNARPQKKPQVWTNNRLQNAAAAIQNRDLSALKRQLGPVSAEALGLARDAKANYWRWVKRECRLATINAIEKTIYDFLLSGTVHMDALRLSFVSDTELSRQKWEALRDSVIETLKKMIENTFSKTTPLADLNAELLDTVLFANLQELAICQLQYRLQVQLKRWEKLPPETLAELFYRHKEARDKSEFKARKYENLQPTLDQNYNSINMAKIWADFELEFKDPNALSALELGALQEIASQPVGNRGATNLQMQSTTLTLLDDAILLYDSVRENEIYPIITYLLQRGAIASNHVVEHCFKKALPTAADTSVGRDQIIERSKLLSKLLIDMLTYAEMRTPMREKWRQHFLAVATGIHNEFVNWGIFSSWFHNPSVLFLRLQELSDMLVSCQDTDENITDASLCKKFAKMAADTRSDLMFGFIPRDRGLFIGTRQLQEKLNVAPSSQLFMPSTDEQNTPPTSAVDRLMSFFGFRPDPQSIPLMPQQGAGYGTSSRLKLIN